MKAFFPSAAHLLLALASLALPLASRAQTTATRVDPTWRPTQLYQPAGVGNIAKLSGGDFVLFGITRAEGQPVNQMARYTASGQLDRAYAANIASYQWQMRGVVPALNNQLMVSLPYVCQLGGGVSRMGLTRLQADGRLDATFRVQPAVTIMAMVVQPDGKTLVRGWFSSYGSSGGSGLVRLNVDGSIDQAFSAQLGAGFTGGTINVRTLALQPDGRIVVGGDFMALSGRSQPLLARLEANGAPDRSFAPPTRSAGYIAALALQPDGRILASGTYGFPLQNIAQSFVRLLPNGQPDLTFTPEYSLAAFDEFGGAHTIQVQPNGSIILAGQCTTFSVWQSGRRILYRLLPNGSFDPSWAFADYGPSGPPPATLVLLNSGQLLVGGFPRRYDSATGRVAGIVVLLPDGTVSPTFRPRVQVAGSVDDILVQPDQQVVIAGNFDEINGRPASRLARLNSSGEVDTAFTARATLGCAEVSQPTHLLLQADGKIIVGGDFASVHGQARLSLARLYPDGSLDASYAPPAQITGNNVVAAMELDPLGRVLLRHNQSGGFLRLTTSGQPDATFVPAWGDYATALRVQPDGRIVVSEGNEVRRLQPTGALDPSFTPVQVTGGIGSIPPDIRGILRYADGRLLIHGSFTRLGTVTSPGIGRVQANGTPDPGFASTLNTSIGAAVGVAALQPNQRVLVSGLIQPSTLQLFGRLLPNGVFDPAFTNTIFDDSPNCVQVQANGSIIVGGKFRTVAGQPHLGLVRLLAPNVLATRLAATGPALEVWPVPAHDQLNLTCEMADQPQRATLLDALGRAVRRVALTQPAQAIGTTGLPPGIYHLRVEYAGAREAIRRIVLE